MKSLLLVFLAMFMLAGCGTDEGTSIGTQQEPSDQDENFVPGETSPNSGEDGMGEDNQPAMPAPDGAGDDNDE